ncbi:MAG TPA: DUF3261 domain-containing protein [Thermoanaerobaculia bacterium]|nr:DUF3261 domain-containing protein [Thermoanaerobaculia bacterium]
MRRASLFFLLFAVACRTSAPTGAPIAPLTATSSAEAIEQLRARRASFAGAQALMRVRATVNGKTQSFRAKLSLPDARRMELVAFTPVGTTAAKITADGDQINVDNKEDFGFFTTSLIPAEMAMLILGLPPRDGLDVDVTPAGLRSARVDNVSIAFDPPAFPAKHALVTRGDDRIDIELLEVVR